MPSYLSSLAQATRRVNVVRSSRGVKTRNFGALRAGPRRPKAEGDNVVTVAPGRGSSMRHGLSAVLKAGFAVGLLAGLGAVAVPALAAIRPALVADPAALVDPFIGTAGGVNTFPRADVPFGMIPWSPATPNRHDGGGARPRRQHVPPA